MKDVSKNKVIENKELFQGAVEKILIEQERAKAQTSMGGFRSKKIPYE